MGSTGRPSSAPIAWLTAISLGLATLQHLSAGFLLSGYAYASTIHRAGAMLLQLVAVVQGGTAVVLWLRRRLHVRTVGLSVALSGIVLLEVWAGRHSEYWLHVPLGVGLLVWLQGRMRAPDRA